ncbi:MAG TPA: type II toxin-antitoxin system VapC family toxin [Solirubrobacteraceae bacterium]|nr:type II toxin-antitoxin system VapC family toxin [Solirubrobacteraceae bacterium]
MSSLLADTHTLLWWRADDGRLGVGARAAMEDPDIPLFFSAASIWEIAIKRAQGKLEVPDNLLDTMSEHGFVELPVLSVHGIRAGALPPHHQDPFDRMIVAQAQNEGLTVVTRDKQIALYDVLVLW